MVEVAVVSAGSTVKFPVEVQADNLPIGGRQHAGISELLRLIRTARLVELQLNRSHPDVEA